MTTVKYIGPEITSDSTLAELCGRPDWHLQVYISWEFATIDIEAVRDGDTSYTGSEYNGHAWSHALDILSADDAQVLIEKLRAIVAEMHAAHSSEWDGSNHRAEYDLGEGDREDLVHAAELAITEARIDAVGGIWDAADYCEDDPPEMNAYMPATDLAALAAELQSAAHDDGIHLHDVEEYLGEYLGELRAALAE